MNSATKPNRIKKQYALRLTALLLFASVLLLVLCNCSAGDNPVETYATTDTAEVTSSPKTTDTLPVETEAITEPAEVTTEVIVPVAEYDFTIMCEAGSPDSLFCDEGAEHEPLYTVRAENIVRDYKAALALHPAQDVYAEVEVSGLSGEVDGCRALLVPAYPTGMRLLCAGFLEDLSAPGLNITAETDGVNTALTDDCSFGGRIYLLFCDALSSDITATSALLFRSDAVTVLDDAFSSLLGGSPAALALSGDFTLEVMMTFLTAAADAETVAGAALTAAGFGALARPTDTEFLTSLVSAVGGFMFLRNSALLPEVNITSTEYIAAYDGISGLLALGVTGEDTVFEVAKLDKAESGELYLPLPRSSAERAAYVSQTDPAGCAVLAVPAGLTGGRQVAAVLCAIAAESADIRDAYISDLLPDTESTTPDTSSESPDIESATSDIESDTPDAGGNDTARRLLDLIIASERIDAGFIFGWGDIDSFTGEALAAGTSSSAMLADRTLKDRIETAATAASIVADRIG